MSSAASLPAYLLPGVSICQPSYLEGDPSFATEILPGPPPVTSIQQGIIKRDPKKPAAVYSYLPTTDPGTTYSGLMHGTLYALENASGSRKRTRDKGCVFTLSCCSYSLTLCSSFVSLGYHSALFFNGYCHVERSYVQSGLWSSPASLCS